MDATYRSELRETNEPNWARFEAKPEQRVSELRSELKADTALIRGDLAGLEGRLESRIAAAMRDQMLLFFAIWAALLVALLVPIIGLVRQRLLWPSKVIAKLSVIEMSRFGVITL